jgi:outer membrane protein insertion porin family
MRYFILILTLAATLLIPFTPVLAEESTDYNGNIGTISVQGNQRVEESTILTYMDLKEGQQFSGDVVNAALKNLFATGFFSDARITPVPAQDGRVDISVAVMENPIVNKIVFEGNKAVEDKDLEGELELKPRSVYTRTKIQADVKRILDIFRRGGRYSAEVTPKVIQRDQNRVDVVYEIKEGPVAKVQKISFLGNVNYNSSTLLKRIRTEEARWYKFLTGDDKYDPERLQYDQELLRRFYTSEGYADFQIKSAYTELSPAKDYFTIVFTLDEGPKYNFGEVSIKSALKGLDAAGLKTVVSTNEGEVYDATQVETSIEALVKELGNRGYAFVEIEPKLDRNASTKIISLNYDVKEGPRVYIEKINITGNVRTLDEVIRREMRLVEGDPYNTAKIARSEQRLNNLGFFERVKINNTPGTAKDKVVINIGVQEKSTGEISLGGGYSTTDGPLAEFGIRESNLLGRGQDLRFSTTVSGIRQQFDIGFTEPYFLDRELSAGFDLFKTQLNISSQIPYQLDTNGGKLRLGYALTEKWQHALNYTFKETEIGRIQDDASIYIRRQAGKNVQSSVGHTISYDNRDNKFSPTSGAYLRVSQDVAGLGGDTRYLRHEARSGYYYPIAPKWTASLQGSGGYIFGFGQDIGIQDRFFLGGSTFRGFENYGVGPHSKSTRDALGGTAYYMVSPELTFPLGLPEDLGFLGQVFMDAGSLWKSQEVGADVSDSNKIRLSAGAGVSWASPFGPIRIDLSQAIIKDEYDKTQVFQFNFGTRF